MPYGLIHIYLSWLSSCQNNDLGSHCFNSTLDCTVSTVTLDDIVTFDTTVAFIIPLIALLMPSPQIWHKEHFWNFSVLQ